MCENQDVVIQSGKVKLQSLPNPSFRWSGRLSEDRELIFDRAYVINREDFDNGIQDCTYQIFGRKFTDLSCMMGETLEQFEDEQRDPCELRKHADGTKFLYFYSNIPTFDFSDRIWDSRCLDAVYRDGEGIHLIHCKCGYRIPQIKLYIGLKKSIPALDHWLKLLDCES